MTENLNLAKYIDHTLLKPEATSLDIERLCREAREFGFACVCVNPTWVELCTRFLHGSVVKVCSVVGFPLGVQHTETKVFEAEHLVRDGVLEIDMVLNLGRLKAGEFAFVENDIRKVVDSVSPVVVKVIIEACLLSESEKIKACTVAKAAGAHFVKTSTGFSLSGASVADVRLMRSVVGPDMGVKAAGGIRDYDSALAMIQAGASRIGASASVQIIKQQNRQNPE